MQHVFKHLSWRDRAAIACVCKDWHAQWRGALEDPSLWRTLDLSNSQQPGPALRYASAQLRLRSALQVLNLELAAGVTDALLLPLRGAELEVLNLNGCQQVTDEGVAALAGTALRRLELYWNLRVTDGLLQALARASPRLEVLNLSGCKQVTDAGVAGVARACPRLTHVDLTRCLAVTPAGYAELARHSPQLRELRAYACAAVNDTVLEVFSVLSELRLLDLCGAHLVTDAGIQALARGCRQLSSINLTWCVQVTDAGVCAVAAGCPSLELLSLHGLRGITDAAVSALAAHCAGTLHSLDLSGCVGVERRGREELRAVLPRLRCFTVHK
ncbi:hypothetical protein WJX81_000531 [Elliptochloris bilobata]|uniref:F-box/LRR-repeat protein 15-like leucin rich repeat domain-containing protein n=1 Tax=Elliptochloris bilobata TaxID=381761 RepID=A0AAW1QX22_9CHLO